MSTRQSKLNLIIGAICGLALLVAGCRSFKSVTEKHKPADKLGTVIVCAADAIAPEKKAAEELQSVLFRITEKKYSIIPEDKVTADTPAIYVGQTAFAGRAGMDFTDFEQEEYALKTVGKSLVIAGGRPNGAWNGVCHFLTRELGCRFFAWDCEKVPRRENLELPTLDMRRKPSFAGRRIGLPEWSFGYTPEGRSKIYRYLRRNFANSWRSAYDRQSKTKHAVGCHNSFLWVDPRRHAESHPEYFSRKYSKEDMKTMKRHDQSGQVCWCNRDVWDITLRKLRAVIKKDRDELPKWKWPAVYYISQNDMREFCACPECKAALKKFGGNLCAVQLRYVNYVAEAIAKEYPDVKILTESYTDTEEAPENILPAANVIIRWADLYTRSDCYRPLTSKFNVSQKAKLDKWKKLGARLAVWDYWNMGIPGPYFNPPRVETLVDAIAPDLRYFVETGVETIFIEAEFCHKHPQNFVDLQYYLGSQLMADVSLSEKMLIKEFMTGYYGPAAPVMTEFLTILREAVKNEKEPLLYISNPVRTYMDGAFLEKVYRLLKKALAAVPVDSDYYRRVQQEMITPLAVILMNPQYDFFQRTGLKKDDIIAEYKKAQLDRINQPWVTVERRKKDKAALKNEIAGIKLEFPAPDFLKDRGRTVKFAWPQMGGVPDPDSPMGKALVARGKSGKEKEMHNLNKSYAGGLYPNSFGIYSQSDKRSAAIIRTDVPQDEKYHWYKISAFDFGPNTFLWGFYWLSRVNLSTVYTPADGLSGYNVWETWISVKYTGPAYVKGSTQKNGVFLDRVILVKPEKAMK